jgi:hypothetical protein
MIPTLNIAEERDKLLKQGFQIIDEHPDGNFAVMARAVPGLFDGKTWIQVAHIPKYSRDVKRFIFTGNDIRKLYAMVEEGERSVETEGSNR